MADILLEYDRLINDYSGRPLTEEVLREKLLDPATPVMEKIVVRTYLLALAAERDVDAVQFIRLIAERQCGRPRMPVDIKTRIVKEYSGVVEHAFYAGNPALAPGPARSGTAALPEPGSDVGGAGGNGQDAGEPGEAVLHGDGVSGVPGPDLP